MSSYLLTEGSVHGICGCFLLHTIFSSHFHFQGLFRSMGFNFQVGKIAWVFFIIYSHFIGYDYRMWPEKSIL